MSDEISESAKAVQEVAKATRAGIEATEKLGGFVSRIINEPLENVVGILTDRLKFMRAERQLRLVDRWREIVKERKVVGALRIVPPKLALPIIENASLEEDDELQDLWANLLASAVDPNFKGTVRSAFIDIIKQLEVIDVHVLKVIYDEYRTWNDAHLDYPGYNSNSPTSHPVFQWLIAERVPDLKPRVYENSIDNLIRVRCIDSYVEDKKILTKDDPYVPIYEDITIHHHYQCVSMTSLGVDFVEACINQVGEKK